MSINTRNLWEKVPEAFVAMAAFPLLCNTQGGRWGRQATPAATGNPTETLPPNKQTHSQYGFINLAYLLLGDILISQSIFYGNG